MTKLTRFAIAAAHSAAWIAKTTILRTLDGPLVAIGLKVKVPTGSPIWRKSLVCDFVGHRGIVTWTPVVVVLSCSRCGHLFGAAPAKQPPTAETAAELIAEMEQR